MRELAPDPVYEAAVRLLGVSRRVTGPQPQELGAKLE